MPTFLSSPVSRETPKRYGKRSVIITLAPLEAQSEVLIGLRLKGTRTEYVVALSDLYRMAALWHGQKVAKAKREARKLGISWVRAQKHFNRQNRIDLNAYPKRERKKNDSDQ